MQKLEPTVPAAVLRDIGRIKKIGGRNVPGVPRGKSFIHQPESSVSKAKGRLTNCGWSSGRKARDRTKARQSLQASHPAEQWYYVLAARATSSSLNPPNLHEPRRADQGKITGSPHGNLLPQQQTKKKGAILYVGKSQFVCRALAEWPHFTVRPLHISLITSMSEFCCLAASGPIVWAMCSRVL